MKCFEHEGKKCIAINGKDYFLIRGYKLDRDKFVFVQVTGNTPLRPEDMPTKDWEIIQTKTSTQKVWTAYRKNYFRYDSEKEQPELIFIGANTKGSYYMALKHLAKKFQQNVPDETLHSLATKLTKKEETPYERDLSKCADEGSSEEDAVIIHFGCLLDEDAAKEILKGDKRK